MTLFSRIARAVAALVAIGAIVAFAAGSALAKDGEVDIEKLSFLPGEITVTVGATVTWTVTDAVPEGHTVTSGAPDGSDIGAVFDSGVGLDANGQTFEHTFDAAGTYPYFCKVHGAAMSGTVVVTEAEGSAGPGSGSGETAGPASVPPGASSAPGPGEGPHEAAQVPPERRLLAGGVLLVAIVIMFGAAAVWRRMNRA